MVEVDAALVVDACEVHLEAPVVRELEPRVTMFAVVVELRADDLVALAPVARRRAREREVERRHVRAEHDLVGRRVEEAAPRSRARVRSSASERRDVSNGPPRFAFSSRR